MKTIGAFLAGVATGWVARSAVDSSRGAVVAAISSGYDLLDWIRRTVATEREYLSDLVAEARARAHPPGIRAAAGRADGGLREKHA